jgi:hypothetical protein
MRKPMPHSSLAGRVPGDEGRREGVRVDMAIPESRRDVPEGDLPMRVVHRPAGLGSLGRQRFTVIAEWAGGMIAREAKTLAPSAWSWVSGENAPNRRLHREILSRAAASFGVSRRIAHASRSTRYPVARTNGDC